jgi:hypothetical protein
MMTKGKNCTVVAYGRRALRRVVPLRSERGFDAFLTALHTVTQLHLPLHRLALVSPHSLPTALGPLCPHTRAPALEIHSL